LTKPKISVIVPLYNAERFIRQCLISVLSSKFQDYEVLVVDDCSTDNSVAEVMKIAPHFDGRLKIFQTETNSGSPGVPRNFGIKSSSGEYVTFVDNDDMILPTALGYFALFADMYAADVVYSEKYFTLAEDKPLTAENLKPAYCTAVKELITMPTLESSDLCERIRRDIAQKFFVLPWGKCYRRDFLLDNGIYFPQLPYAEDLTFCFKCLCLAKNYLRIPHMTNVRRQVTHSASKGLVSTHAEGTRRWLKVACTNMRIIDEFMGGLEFFKQNPDCRRDVFDYYVGVNFNILKDLFIGCAPHEVAGFFFDELQNPELDPKGKDIIAAYLFTQRALRPAMKSQEVEAGT